MKLNKAICVKVLNNLITIQGQLGRAFNLCVVHVANFCMLTFFSYLIKNIKVLGQNKKNLRHIPGKDFNDFWTKNEKSETDSK